MKKLVYIFIISVQYLNAQNFITSEQFTACSLPDQWSMKTDEGTFGFSIIKSSLMPTYDATCSIVYTQSSKNDNTSKKFSIRTKEFNLFAYDQYTFSYGLKFTKTNQNSNLKLYSVIDGQSALLQTFTSDVSQNGIVLVTQTQSINTSGTNRKLQFVFEYSADGNDYNSLVLIDNLSLYGPDNDDCTRAVSLQLDKACLSGNNTGAFMTGPAIKCTGTYYQGLWYKYTSDYSGYLKINTLANFNDAVSVFEGTCPSLKDINCFNTDEYGFEGERNFIQVEPGKTYYFRVARQYNYYGRDDVGDLCVSIQKLNPVYPTHDHCVNNIPLQINASCTSELNIAADFSTPVPSLNNKSRADVWYSFKPTSTQPLEIISHADFADVLTVFKGNCNQLEEVICEDLGGKLILSNPVVTNTYFIQVSGYFSTIEGHLCMEVKTKSSTKPTNEDCPTAKAIALNQACQASSTINSIKSNVKPSCVVYSAPDVWYSFVAPAEKNVAISIECGFLYNWAIYSGTCTNLMEFSCGRTPDPCSGYITVNGLIAGKTYYLQILAAVNPLKASEGELCVRIDELSKVTPFEPLNFNLQVECLHGVLGKVSYTASGGKGQYKYEGPGSNDIFYPGTIVEAFIEDESGCREFDKVSIDCTPPTKCKTSTLDLEVSSECIVDNIGRQTGEVILHINGKGGSGAYFIYGTQDGSKLKHGDDYQIIIIDTDSCYVIEQGRINCPPFDCSQSQLSISTNYVCVDTLLKAVLQVDVKGNLGTFNVTGNKTGDLLDQGQHYQTEVVDEAGCSSISSGDIKCNFDSCAYSRPKLVVSYDCIVDDKGNKTGKAIMIVNAESHAGGIVISGNQNGDTLNNLDKFVVNMIDSFGCSLSLSGDIDCIITNNNNPNHQHETSFYPNPAQDKLIINIPHNNDSEILFSIFNSEGALFHRMKSNPLSSNNTIQLNIEKFPSGILYVKMEGNQFFDIIRFVKI